MKKTFFQIERHNTKIAIIQEGIRDMQLEENGTVGDVQKQ